MDTSDIDLVIEGGDSILKLGQTKLRTSGVSSISCKRTSMEKCSSVINVSQDIKKPLGLTVSFVRIYKIVECSIIK